MERVGCSVKIFCLGRVDGAHQKLFEAMNSGSMSRFELEWACEQDKWDSIIKEKLRGCIILVLASATICIASNCWECTMTFKSPQELHLLR